jgi:hypothetical protein
MDTLQKLKIPINRVYGSLKRKVSYVGDIDVIRVD